jgi:hypothetical protein
MKAQTTVRTQDLEEVIDYLEGLLVILRQLHADKAGKDEPHAMLDQLDKLEPELLSNAWAPLRYQPSHGQGWSLVAENLEELRHRLVEVYGDAAL